MKKNSNILLLTIGFFTCSFSAFANDVEVSVMPNPTLENPNPAMPQPREGEYIAQ